MLTVPVFNMEGKRTGQVEVDPEVLGRRVRPRIIKQAIVAFLDHQRQYSARTKGRSDVEGSTRKIFRQKGTGNARMGTIRTGIRRGGGCTFAKRVPRSRKAIPKKMRRLALCSALLAKIEANEALIVEDLVFAEPKTRAFASMLSALGVERGCLVALHERDKNTYLSGRNIPDTDIRLVDDLNAYEVLRRRRLIFTGPAFKRVTDRGTQSTGGR